MSFFDLPEEIVFEIAKKLPYIDIFYFAIINHTVFNHLIKYGLIKGVLPSYSLSIEQLTIVENLRKSNVDILILQAPPSMGKTAIILQYLLGKSAMYETPYYQEKGIGIIVVPNSLHNTWIKEITQSFPSFLSLDNPEESSILIYNKKYPNHYNYIEKKQLTKVRVILSSYTYKNGHYKNLLNLDHIRELVFDEAHNKQGIKDDGTNIPRILMSANYIGEYRKKEKTQNKIIVSHDVIKNVIPESTERITTQSLSNTIEEVLRNHRKIVVFLSKKQDIRFLNKNYGPDILLVFLSTTNPIVSISEFDEYQGKAILIGTLRTLGTGHNLRGDACIIVQTEKVSSSMVLQVKSRLLRITNPNNIVDITFVVTQNNFLATARYRIAITRLLQDGHFGWLSYYKNGYYNNCRDKVEKVFVSYGLTNSLSDMPDICVVFYYLAREFFTCTSLYPYVERYNRQLVESGYFSMKIWQEIAMEMLYI